VSPVAKLNSEVKMKKIITVLIVFAVLAAGVFGYLYFQYNKGDDMSYEKIPPKSFSDIPVEKLEALSQKRVFFGHQSIGVNIVEGLARLDKTHDELNLDIVETTDLANHEGPVFAHARVGKNLDPNSKVDDFARIMKTNLKDKVDIAFFKFCYVDFRYDTDLRPVLDYYKSAMDRLKKECPNVTFVHCTVPLNLKTGGLKGFVKNILGRDHNIKRSEYNRMLRKVYDPGEIFDLERFVSTYPDGRREKSGKNSYAIVPAYSGSGGHLNEKGQEVVAVQLLDFLAAL